MRQAPRVAQPAANDPSPANRALCGSVRFAAIGGFQTPGKSQALDRVAPAHHPGPFRQRRLDPAVAILYGNFP